MDRLEALFAVDRVEPTSVDLDQAFRTYSPYVARIALRLVGRDGEVDDVVQEVFLVAYRSLGALRDPEALKGWLATVTVRIARKRLRYRKVRGWFGLEASPDYDALANRDASPEQRSLLAKVYQHLDAMPVEQRLAWTLRHVEGEQLEDVAALCGCSLATAKRRIAAAHEALTTAVHHA